MVALYGDPNVLQVVDPIQRTLVRKLTITPSATAFDMAYSRDGALLAAVTSIDPQTSAVYVWERNNLDPRLHYVQADSGRAASFSPDGNELYLGLVSGRVEWWERDSGTSGTAVVSSSPILDMSFSPDGRSLLLACEDGLIRLWDVAGRRVQTTFDWVIGSLGCVAFAPDGLTAAAGGDGVILVWDVD
jgi:WD40 repeat protein